jgi:hypothetical protein
MRSLFLPTYFPSISHLSAMAQADGITFEVHDHFQKQTNRSRTYINSPNGIQLLNIPIKHSNERHQAAQDVKIEWAFDWQKQHFKSLEAAYRTSPFFEYYEDKFMPLFIDKPTFLLDLNFRAMELVFDCLGLPFIYEKTEEYFHERSDIKDFRCLANGKKDQTTVTEYPQVFADKHGFISNLSVLDLLFNEGRFALDYLRQQTL